MVALLVIFVVFPAMVMLIGRRVEASNAGEQSRVTTLFARLTLQHGKVILAANAVLAVVVVLGVLRLEVENSFINYFKPSTEIYQGMVVVDQRLGGTTPLDVILQFPPVEDPAKDDSGSDDDEFDLDFGFDEEPEDPAKYWFTPNKVETVRAVHRYLEAQPEIGKVLSLATMVDIAENLNGEALGSVELALLYSSIPEDFRAIVLDPYADPEAGQLRVNLRIYDSDPDLKRSELLQRIQRELHAEVGLAQDQYFLAGMMVLYNNMLQSLFKSQIMTLGAVFFAIMLMFVGLFRSFTVAVLAIIPNLLSAGAVLAVMGWLNIPLDMMTITIAAITVGIAVDTTIHYIVRFKREFAVTGSYEQSLERSHASIGRAIWYTSMTIIVGFSILALSNFIPTILFGVLTGLAMLMALVMVLTLLPQLLVTFKPLGK
jgi:predicted RND superfamily exporter protein